MFDLTSFTGPLRLTGLAGVSEVYSITFNFSYLHQVRLHKSQLKTSRSLRSWRINSVFDKMNNPIPANLKSEAKKAGKILREFTEISNRMGPDKLIPAHVIAKAQGLAILSVFKAGFMITARGGSGIVIARLTDGRWSAPSAIGIAGLGGGFEIGLESSDFVIILNQRRAVDAFSKGGNLTLGGNCTVAVGPLGRNLEADVAFRSTAAVYSYCKSRGLYAGVSLVGSYLIERKETNRKFYGQDIRASAILNGDVEPPPEAYDLYTILQDYTEKYTTDWQNKHMPASSKVSSAPSRPRPPTQRAASSYTPRTRAPASVKPALYPSLDSWDDESSDQASGGTLVVTAVHPFTGQQPGDLSFSVGDRITVITKTDSQYDWWEGELRGQVGIFPANFVSYS
ncbi:SH3 domain-containing YSC84-like protein 1 [Pseudorasbora parva]|uniref:SH3 domain-containing YSC84-like protein 1 n=1 Tax=Pseudorasbora parva TaxID=51549 RepID=UPI00351F1686